MVRFIQSFFLRNILTAAICLVLMVNTLSAQPAPSLTVNDLRGAELYANMLGNGRIQVCLKVYYTCGTQIPTDERVSLYETMGNRLISTLELKRDSFSVMADKVSYPCFQSRDVCMQQAVYSVKTDLGLAYMDYDLSWAYCFFDRSIRNIDHLNRQGFALSVHLPNPAVAKPNIMPSLTTLPMHHLCNNTSTSFELAVSNPDSDEVFFKSGSPAHFTTKDKPAYEYTATQGATLNDVIKNPTFCGSFLANHPPYQDMVYTKGYSAANPFMNSEWKLNEKTGKIEMKAGGGGKHLISITLLEKRNQVMLSEHAVVFISEIK